MHAQPVINATMWQSQLLPHANKMDNEENGEKTHTYTLTISFSLVHIEIRSKEQTNRQEKKNL